MPYNGSGVFSRLYSWVNDAANGIDIKADRMDGEMDGMAAGLSNCLTRDGQGKPSAAIDWNNQNLNNVNSLAVNTLAVANGATVPDVAAGDSSGKAANTKFVATAVAASSNSAPRVAGLTGNVNATTPLTKFDLTCNFVTLRNANSATVTLYGPHSRTVDLGLAGAVVNGRDQAAAFAANSWAHLYWIWDGATLGLIASLSATAPTLPTGYTHWCYATTIRFNASSNILPVNCDGSMVFLADLFNVANGAPVNGVETAISLTGAIPPNALHVYANAYAAIGSSATSANACYMYLRTTSGKNNAYLRTHSSVSSGVGATTSYVKLQNKNQNLYYLWQEDNANTASRVFSLDIGAYAVSNGDA